MADVARTAQPKWERPPFYRAAAEHAPGLARGVASATVHRKRPVVWVRLKSYGLKAGRAVRPRLPGSIENVTIKAAPTSGIPRTTSTVARILASLAAFPAPALAADGTELPAWWGLVMLGAGVLGGFMLGRRRNAPSAHPAAIEEAAAAPPPAPARPADAAVPVGAGRELDDSRQHYLEMLESLNEVIFRIDAQGRLTFLNGVWRKLSGHKIDQSLGKPLLDFLHPDDRERARDTLDELASGRIGHCDCELRLRTRGGEIRWIALTARPVDPASGPEAGIAGTLDDISARKVAELTLKNLNQELEARVRLRTAELEASNQELEAFSYSVSHDLRAPLRAIDGFARILEEELDDRLDEASRSHLERIRRASERMAQLIDALINLAMLTRQSLRKETFDLSELAHQIIDDLQAEDPGRRVDVEITAGLMVTADRTLMHAMLDNLLRNAWKFTSRTPDARIVFRAERDDGRRVFCVEDNGAGFDMSYAGNLFRPFHRMHGSDDYPGAGIGLATVQRIVQRHEGSIWVDSRPNEGARFRFTLGR